MWNQIGQPRPPAVDEIKIFDNNDKAAKHSERKRTFYGLVIIIKNFISLTAGGLGHPIWFHIFFILAFLYIRGVLVEIKTFLLATYVKTKIM